MGHGNGWLPWVYESHGSTIVVQANESDRKGCTTYAYSNVEKKV